MKKSFAVVVIALASVSTLPVLAATRDGSPAAPSAAQSRQQSRMAVCNQDAVGKKGDERKAFMKQCLSGAAPAQAKEAGKPARDTTR